LARAERLGTGGGAASPRAAGVEGAGVVVALDKKGGKIRIRMNRGREKQGKKRGRDNEG
jgi:hypothetical protein